MRASYGPLHRASRGTQFLPFGCESAVPVHDGAPIVLVRHEALFHRAPGLATEDRIQLELTVPPHSLPLGLAFGPEAGERPAPLPSTDFHLTPRPDPPHPND